jgi:purine-binding chemotaxis protein CheW
LGARTNATHRKNLVGFEVGGVSYAVDILRVREIIRPLAKLDVPTRVAAGLAGIADHRGHVVPVIDMRVRLGVAPRGRDRDVRWLILKVGVHFVGLVVDRVLEVFGSTEPAGRDVSHLAAPGHAALVQAAYRHRGALVFVLDVDRLITQADLNPNGEAPDAHTTGASDVGA